MGKDKIDQWGAEESATNAFVFGGLVSQYCPAWIYSSTCALIAQRYLAGNVGLEPFAVKYAELLGTKYSDINDQILLATAEGFLRHLMEAEVDDASEILESYAYNTLTYDRTGGRRKIKGFFSSALDGQKVAEVSVETSIKEFKPFIYMYRSKPELAAPIGWTWASIEDGDFLKTLPDIDVSFLDGI